MLRAAGREAVVQSSPDFVVGAGDVVHLHNIQRVLDWGHLPERARAAGAAVVVSPLYHPVDDYHRRGRRGLDAGLARLVPDADVFAGLRWGRTSGLRERAVEVLEAADRLLFVHPAERDLVAEAFGVRDRASSIVPVAIPPVEPGPGPAGGEPIVACVGRIEPLKNPLAVLEAARGLGARVVFAGPPAGARHAGYVARLRASVAAAKHAEYRGELRRSDVLDLLRRAHVHVLASWTEVVGRVSLEAAACGAAVVATEVGCAPRYLADTSARFVPAGVPSALREAVAAALAAPRPGPDDDAAARVRSRYTWDVVGPALVAALQEVAR